MCAIIFPSSGTTKELTAMDWGLIVTIFFTIGFGAAAMVLALKLARRKRPVWAYKTRKIVGLGSDAPPELKLVFSGVPVSDVCQTTLIFLNKGTDIIRKDDVTDNVTIHFPEARILRQPTIRATSNDEVRFLARQLVKGGDNAVQLDFLYLAHHDGAVIEVMHTESQQISHSGNIMGTRIVNIGEFDPSQPRPTTARPVIMATLVVSAVFLTIARVSWGLTVSPDILSIVYLLAGGFLAVAISDVRNHIHYRRFPTWSRSTK